jgi:hypothetical protein
VKITVRGYKPLVIPPEFVASEMGAFTGDTPYVTKLTARLSKKSYLLNKLPAKLLCLEALKSKMIKLGGYLSLAEPLAGVGLSVRVLDNGGPLFLNDADATCQKILKKNFGGKPTTLDAATMEFPEADAIFLDFNNFTLKRYLNNKYSKSVDKAFASASKFVILNDCSIFYFRYGEKSWDTYSRHVGARLNCVEDYFDAVARIFRSRYKGWALVKVAHFSDAAFLLFAKGSRSKLSVDFVKAPEPIVEVSL